MVLDTLIYCDPFLRLNFQRFRFEKQQNILRFEGGFSSGLWQMEFQWDQRSRSKLTALQIRNHQRAHHFLQTFFVGTAFEMSSKAFAKIDMDVEFELILNF